MKSQKKSLLLLLLLPVKCCPQMVEDERTVKNLRIRTSGQQKSEIRCEIFTGASKKSLDEELHPTEILQRRFEGDEGWVCSRVNRQVVPVPDGAWEE